MKKILLLLSFSVLAFPVQEYYSLSRSIRSLGMGGAFYALSNDEYALFYNPAGLSLYQGESEGMLRLNAQSGPNTVSGLKTLTGSSKSVSSIVESLASYQGKPLFGQVGLFPYYVRKNFGIGLLLADTKFNFAILGKEIDTDVDFTAISDSGLIIGYGRPAFHPNLHIGLNSKLLVRAGGRKLFSALDVAQNQNFEINPKEIGGAGGGIDFDLGAIYDFSEFPWGLVNRVSLTINNIVATNFSIGRTGGEPPQLPRMVSFGYYTVFSGWKFIDNFHILADLSEWNLGGQANPHLGQRAGSLFKHLNLGVEMPMNWFTLRAGIRQGYWGGGFGVNFKFLKIDFATYGEELAGSPGRLQSRRFAVTLAIGGGNPPTAPFIAAQESTPGLKESIQ